MRHCSKDDSVSNSVAVSSSVAFRQRCVPRPLASLPPRLACLSFPCLALSLREREREGGRRSTEDDYLFDSSSEQGPLTDASALLERLKGESEREMGDERREVGTPAEVQLGSLRPNCARTEIPIASSDPHTP